jgi:hypothetical protein
MLMSFPKIGKESEHGPLEASMGGMKLKLAVLMFALFVASQAGA